MQVAFHNNTNRTRLGGHHAAGHRRVRWRRRRLADRWLVVAVAGRGRRTAFGTTNQFAYFYAEAEDGTWWGDNAGPGAYVTDDVFDDCVAIGHSAPWRVVSMAEINVGWPPALPGRTRSI